MNAIAQLFRGVKCPPTCNDFSLAKDGSLPYSLSILGVLTEAW
jgi:hypothetical protein